MEAGVPARLTVREGRRFAFTVGAAFLVLAAIAWWRHHPLAWRTFALLGGLLAAAGAAIPDRLGPVHGAWMGFARLLSKVTTPVFMAVVYFGVLTPIAFLMRAAGRRPMRHPLRDDSYWAEPPSGGRSDLTHQF